MPNFDDLINPEKPYSLENLSYWLEFLPEDFILSIVNSLGKQTQSVEGWTKFVHDNADDIEITLAGSSVTRSLKDVCDALLNASARLNEILQLAYTYARELEKQRKNHQD
ncbi:MAG TPA: hypothetical protein VHL11_20920 [Phototrophicaceae bacterium]|jgi:hypothetical protein|nr:hypothetical protein [Phototrophicaceae bacterium]